MNELSPTVHLLGGAALFVIGFSGLLTRRHLLRRILALNVMAVGVFWIFVALAARAAGKIPDPVPHAMVLTGIVVSVCATGLALALADRVQAASGQAVLDDLDRSTGDSGDDDEGGP